ncbi:hypothetical protein MCUN1_000435 [Malassezia cuniculi]|uniref:Uncharacterized protein n=1 Tax=Malassezia cuniculi TaxID=948313 RepID=A0AAF0EVD0_9BASI|nr:hypothetical protein MCUN1_000435 [Malassezia cuniculi]
MWHILGLQGAILSLWLEPVRASSITISGADDAALAACHAAVAGRHASAPLTVYATSIQFPHALEPVQAKVEADTGIAMSSAEWDTVEPVPCAASIVWRHGKKHENLIGGIRLGAARKEGLLARSAWSSVSKRAFFEQARAFASLPQHYDEAKDSAEHYQSAKAALRGIESDDQALDGRRALPKDPVRETSPVEDAPAPEPVQQEPIADPKKLLKRAKLMRLKAKKTTSPESRAAYTKKVHELEREASRLNGKRGALGKRSRGLASQDSAFRRQNRADSRNPEMRCYVCREVGHSAKDCTQNTGEGDTRRGRDTVGICFRCGSTSHNLSKCPKPATDSLPFATCYVCSQMGHLASQCPKNRGRGIYPNGGDCKICHSVEHLARDCPNARERGEKSERTQRSAASAAPPAPPKKIVSFQ